MKYFTREVKIALVAIVGIVILFLGINFLKGINIFQSDDTYYITFKNINGLTPSTPIYADGYRVGSVKDIIYDYGQNEPIKVVAGISKDLRIPLGSSAEIVTDMMGNQQVNLLLANNPRQRVEPGQTIVGDVNNGALGKLKTLVPYIENMMPKLDSILTSVNILLADPAIASSLHNIQNTTANLTVSTQRLNSILSQVDKDIPGIVGKANRVLDNTNHFTSNLASLDVQETLNKVNATLESAHEFTEKLNSKEGTLGKLMNDPGLYNHLNSTVRNADSLVVDLKAHPKRYVHFSLFGRKDK